MDTQKIEELILILEGSGASELEVRQGDCCVRAVKSQLKLKKSARKVSAKAELPVASEQPESADHSFILAPMVGIFHFGSAAVDVKHNVTIGQPVGMIESMKIHNEVISQVSGVVSESMVEDGTPVEYGQPLFCIVPEDI